MAFLYRSHHLLKTGVNYNQFCRIVRRTIVQHHARHSCSSSSGVWFCVSNSQRHLLANPCPVLSLWKVRTYATKRMGGKGSKRKTILSDEELMNVVDVASYRESLQAVVSKLKADYVTHLSVRSAAGSIESLPVKVDGDEYPLNELAQISRKNPQLIAINMAGYPEGLKPTLQAITESGLGINPQQEGTMIYLTIPKVTREFRDTLAKSAKTLFTKAKDEIRNIQNSAIKQAKSQTELSEDLVYSAVLQLTAIGEHYTAEAEKVLRAKQNDLLGNS